MGALATSTRAAASPAAIKTQYQHALDRGGDGELRLAGPAGEAVGELDSQSVHWLQTNFLKTQLELGHCLRLPAEGSCECDLYLACSKFLTTSDYAPAPRPPRARRSTHRRRAVPRLDPRGRTRPRHRRRIEELLAQLGGTASSD